jgi:hypothetical protein
MTLAGAAAFAEVAAARSVATAGSGPDGLYASLVGDGTDQTMTVTMEAGNVVFRDSTGVTAGPGCVQGPNVKTAMCENGAIVATGAGGADTIRGLVPYTADGGPGADTIYGSDDDDTLMGGTGPDTISGRGGADTLDGGEGDDILDARDGVPTPDSADCGPGPDDLVAVDPGGIDLISHCETETTGVPPPNTTIVAPTSGQITTARPYLRLMSTKPGSTYVCDVGGSTFACADGQQAPTLPAGPQTLSVTATDSEGRPDPTPASVNFVVDAVAPPAFQLSATDPASPADEPELRVRGTGAEDGSTVQVYASADCTGRLLADGPAVAFNGAGLRVTVPENTTTALSATAIDRAGNVSPCTNTIAYRELGAAGIDCASALRAERKARAAVAAAATTVGKAKKKLDRARRSGKKARIEKAKRRLRQARAGARAAAARLETAEAAASSCRRR